ncbi:MAG TPA: hypothetical protein VND64_28140 [Pirellulales bacterium]|nr:hypothetical protein [Pirellulales bacterium]
MATGLEMFDALRQATSTLPSGGQFHVNRFDADDLRKLSVPEFISMGWDSSTAELVVRDLANGKLGELGTALGVRLCITTEVKNLIPGEGFRRMARVPIDDGQTDDEMFEEVDRIRHPERYPA